MSTCGIILGLFGFFRSWNNEVSLDGSLGSRECRSFDAVVRLGRDDTSFTDDTVSEQELKSIGMARLYEILVVL